MDLLIRSAHITDPNSPHNGKICDILIDQGVIRSIGERLQHPADYKIFSAEGARVSPGWFDLSAYLADPGYEYKEDLMSGARAAAAGGFTGVCCLPDTDPPIHSKSEVEYVINKAKGGLVDIFPIGAISRSCNGDDITEMHDMNNAGAVAFSDGINRTVKAGLMERALFYVKPFRGAVFSYPDEESISEKGHLNEGEVSIRLGLNGIPDLSEELVVMRDIHLAEYTGSRVHFLCLSTEGGLNLVRRAKEKGLKVSASIPPHVLSMDETSVESFDTNYKTLPPLRDKKTAESLARGVKDGIIDSIASFHLPQNEEAKKVEFDLAAFGTTALETTFSLAWQALQHHLSPDDIVRKLAVNPREIVGQTPPLIREEEEANLTVFNEKAEWKLEEDKIQSKSKNTPLIDQPLQGKVLGVVNRTQTNLPV
jgi:dihydroorotase